jgi:hypothetical protein
MDALLRFLVPFAQRQIDRQGGFLPFGAAMAPDGELEALTVEAGDTTLEEQLQAIRDGARDRADTGEVMAVGICSDVSVTAGGYQEGIRVELEHRDAEPITCVLPYRNTDEELVFGEIVAMPGARHTWV